MIDYESLLELIRRRRTVRLYDPDQPVNMADIERVIEAARWAPSGANSQPCEYVVVTERAALDEIDLALRERRKRRLLLRAQAGARYLTPSKDALVDGNALIVVCSDPRMRRAYPSSSEGDVAVADPLHAYYATFGATLENLHLAATALGLGLVWISVDPDMEQVLRDLLDIPEVLQIVFCCPIGYPSREPAVPTHRPLDEIIHWETYDRPRLRDEAQVKQWLEVDRIAGWRSG
ncbi:MAG TPA: nitroreductase family protein [Anaerolineae bacterium]